MDRADDPSRRRRVTWVGGQARVRPERRERVDAPAFLAEPLDGRPRRGPDRLKGGDGKTVTRRLADDQLRRRWLDADPHLPNTEMTRE